MPVSPERVRVLEVEPRRIELLPRVPGGSSHCAVGVHHPALRQMKIMLGDCSARLRNFSSDSRSPFSVRSRTSSSWRDLLVQAGVLHGHGDLVRDGGGQEEILFVVGVGDGRSARSARR